MSLLNLDHWTIWFALLVMIVVAWTNLQRGYRIANSVTLPFILFGWALGLLHTLNLHLDAGQGSIGDALGATVLSLVLLLPIYAIGGIGEGSVKLQMGFSSWVGAFYGSPRGYYVTAGAFLGTMVVFGLMYLAMLGSRGKDKERQILPTGIAQALAAIICVVMVHVFCP